MKKKKEKRLGKYEFIKDIIITILCNRCCTLGSDYCLWKSCKVTRVSKDHKEKKNGID